MRRELRPTLPTNRFGVRAEPVNFLESLPDVRILKTWSVHRGLQQVQCGRDVSRGRPVVNETGAPCPERSISAAKSAHLRVAVARSAEEIDAAHYLVRRRYAWRGYEVETMVDPCAPKAQSRREQEITIVAATLDVTIGTVTLRFDGPGGLLAEETHGVVIETVRASGRRVCELTRLAVAERVDSKSVLASLFGAAYATGRAIDDVTDVFIEVNPRHVAYYSRILGFVVAAGEKLCERVCAPSVLLHAEVEALAARLRVLADIAMPHSLLGEAA